MAFVYEKVGEENRELWESIGLKDCFGDTLRFYKGGYWSINKEKKYISCRNRRIYRYA